MADLFSAFASVAGDLATGWLNNESAEDRQNAAQNFSANQFANRYQTTVKDMQAAGLNPMLAYSQGGGSPPSGTPVSSAGTPSLGRSYSSAYNLEREGNLLEEKSNATRAESWLKSAQTDLAFASADQAKATTNRLEMEAKKISEELLNIPVEGDRLRALIENLHSSSALIDNQAKTETQRYNQMKWLALKTMLESDLVNLDVEAAKDLGNLGRYGKEGKIVFDLIRLLTRR